MTRRDEKIEAFRRLHEAGCFVMPNPWDAGSAAALERMGFKALATTSAGHAWTLARTDTGSAAAFAQPGSAPVATSAGQGPTPTRPDQSVRRDEALEHLGQIAGAVSIPVNADFENCFADDPDAVATNVKLAVATGVAGLSIEDSTGDTDEPLYPFELAVERVRAARQAIDQSGTGVVLTGRSEGFVVGRPDLEETIRRLQAYADAGADCLYAPWISTADEVSAIVTAVAPRPVNLLVNKPFITVAEAASLGVRRISVGGTLARTAWAGFLAAAEEIATEGTFTRFVDLPNVDAIVAG
ncbi:MAG TPA: isocitrate lyase/phosphoenolpyruvate mutase family protein [Gaiellaceae bacterium]|jgi:2-methylisocitrate lyase-like PEP mutase family enzyme|nr:isocitrate lyase/phosphoenolpyruvate mutase family protein [Gaiellaceae bacterium]